MAILNEKIPYEKIRIDLSGPNGNAFVLIVHAKHYAKQIGYSEEEIDALVADMKSGDYEHLITVFDNHFGAIVDLYRGR